jgi:flavorubredoxin
MVQNYRTSPEIKNVVICIGTNDGYVDLGVEKLINSICRTFPNSKMYVVQGSWGWGGVRRITSDKVKNYYQKYKSLGVTVIETPIGKREPHRDCPTYKKIGEEIDTLLYL